MKTFKTLSNLALTGALLSGGPALAQSELLDGWSGSAGISAILTAGNSDTQNLGGSVNVSKQQNVWTHNAFGSIYNAENNDVETANRFDLGYKIDRQFNDLMYGFGRLRYDSDDYGNIDGRFSGVVGVGRRFIQDQKQSLSGEIGIGGHSTDYISLTPVTVDQVEVDDAGVFVLDGNGLPVVTQIPDASVEPLESLSESGATLYGGLKYSNILSDMLTFNSAFTFEAADSNTYTVWDNSLNIAVSDRISLALGLLTRSNSDIVGPLNEKTDTATRISFVYGI